MYLRRTERRTKDGSVAYLQLAHNEWDPVAKQSKVRVIYNFGREDQLDREADRVAAAGARARSGASGCGGAGAAVRRVAADGRGVGAGWVVAATGGRPHGDGAACAPAPRWAGGAGDLRDGRQPCTGAAVEARGQQVGDRARVDPGAAGAG